MIRGIILYYLSIKPTHGYEIQQFVQVSGMDQWTKIQSGSIYYALTKLEKEGNISVLREERTGARLRKIYQITKKGRDTLYVEMKQALATPLMQSGSSKYITSPMLVTLSEEDITIIIHEHIMELEENLAYWKKWCDRKSKTDKYNLVSISFQMNISSLEYQIEWHKELLKHLDYYKKDAQAMTDMIHTFDTDCIAEIEEIPMEETQLKILSRLKEEVSRNPQQAIDRINELIQQIDNKK